MITRTIAILPALVLAVATSAALSGCNLLGPASYIVAGTGSVPAEHKIVDRPTVVFVDDRENVVSPTMYRRVIAEKVSEELMVRKLVTRTISPADAMALAAQHDTSKEVMPVDAIGRAVGAEQVIYIEMVAFHDRSDGQIPRPAASCNVRVIDVTNRVRLFPESDGDQPYRFVKAVTREFDPEYYRTRASRNAINETLANELGSAIAKLFYKHEARDLGGQLSTR